MHTVPTIKHLHTSHIGILVNNLAHYGLWLMARNIKIKYLKVNMVIQLVFILFQQNNNCFMKMNFVTINVHQFIHRNALHHSVDQK